MIHADTHPTNVKLWLALGRRRNVAKLPGRGSDRPNIQTRSLRVLIVEDEFFISLHTKGLLQALGHVAVAVAVSADQAVAIAERNVPTSCSWTFDCWGRATASMPRKRSAIALGSAAFSSPPIRMRRLAGAPRP